ncbi:GtrA family protein [Corynebacterium sp. ES2794-CONJ1]|uniref:GtrA family protein n=1 Tax=unclassified Corynebacterium TaxID=2624378 RepID=UPI002167D90F|nr:MULTISPECIES: GtrA family protein [unclassified Corynebacterium]MCS4490380.1 GtrA family protein [Corynebacterium sp. ES2775-CONJ]MCS4492160.1 GtrA family protein [Corynebacterium sp. ES2715-CONJ3]MCS4532358.1 GtrA family protein [Corynebacterium sp. ES2730-CONJ]MCU9519679.1 GtrA family protein [Corynebacterium sp. ES2794-CONJ1]
MSAQPPSSSLKTQLSRFIAVGIVAAIVDYGSTLILNYLFGFPRSGAKALGWCAGTVTAYVMNSKWTFNATTSKKSGLAVAALYLSTFAVQNFVYYILNAPLSSLGLEQAAVDTVSFVIAQGLATITNFVVQRMVIFKEPRG